MLRGALVAGWSLWQFSAEVVNEIAYVESGVKLNRVVQDSQLAG